jgi:hypothetical protein
MNDVQALVDGLATALGQPAGVDDRRFRAVAYSSHTDDIDAVRRASILGREAPAEVIAWLESVGVLQARGHLRIPANPELGMVARVCFALRFHERLLGFLWLADADASLDDTGLAICSRFAPEIAEALYRDRLDDRNDRRRGSQELDRLLRGDPARGDQPTLLVASAPRYAAIVIEVVADDGGSAPAGVGVRLTEAADRGARAIPLRHQLTAVSGARARIVVAAARPADIAAHGGRLLAVVRAEIADLPASVRVGVGDAVDRLDLLPSSLESAELALRIGRMLPQLGPLVASSELGVMRLIGNLLGQRDPGELLPPSLRSLMAEHDADTLLTTLEAYLEHGGDVAEAAAELYVHRSSLYHRLHRIERVAGVSIRSGTDRLELHLGIRLWRLAGSPLGQLPSRPMRQMSNSARTRATEIESASGGGGLRSVR